jgi:hypothetical protein
MSEPQHENGVQNQTDSLRKIPECAIHTSESITWYEFRPFGTKGEWTPTSFFGMSDIFSVFQYEWREVKLNKKGKTPISKTVY